MSAAQPSIPGIWAINGAEPVIEIVAVISLAGALDLRAPVRVGWSFLPHGEPCRNAASTGGDE
jgi:hypothetical protein